MRPYPDVSQSMATYARAGDLIPGWTQLISRRADQFANGVSPVYAQRAKGSRFIDVDENEYIDWVNAVGAIILGHADDVVDEVRRLADAHQVMHLICGQALSAEFRQAQEVLARLSDSQPADRDRIHAGF